MTLFYGLLVVRVLIGLAVASHGAQKLFGWFGGYGIAGTGDFFEQLGFRPGKAFAALAGLGELAGGLLLALGLFGAVGPMLILATMFVAILSVHAKNGFFATNNGFELPLLYALASWTFAFGGFGPYSLDHALAITVTRGPHVVWGLLVLGILGALGSLAARRTPSPQSQASGT